MKRREFSAAVWVGIGWSGPAWASDLSEGEATAGVRAALQRGALAAVSLLGRSDGFLGNPKVRIELPERLANVASLLKATGQQHRLDELVTAMNRAAEAAVPAGKAVLVGAVQALSVEDALRIVRGGQTSVTDFFAAKTRAPLAEKFLPIVTRATEKVKLAERYNVLAARAARLGLIRGDDTNVERHVTARALEGLFTMIGEEEVRIRTDPLRTGSAILKRVFGG